MSLNRRQTLAGAGSAALAACAPKPAIKSYDGDAEVLILGAGLAGLRAAQILSNAGKDVRILEANDRVGGRVYTLRHKDGFTEAGGARIQTTDKRIQALASSLGLLLEPEAAPPAEISVWSQGKSLRLAPDQIRPFLDKRAGAFESGGTNLRIGGGAQRLPEAMANSLLNWPVLKTYVQSISVTDTRVTARDHTGRVWRAEHMICTLPYAALRHLQIDASLPGAQKISIARLPYVQNLQIHFRAKTKFWEKDGLPPDMFMQESLGQIIANRDTSGQVTGLFHCTFFYDQLSWVYRDGLDRLHQRFRAELARLRPSTYANIEIIDVVDWTKDNRAAGGSYITSPSAGNSERVVPIGDPVGGLHFAGSHLAREFIGMEGALESAENVAAVILA